MIAPIGVAIVVAASPAVAGVNPITPRALPNDRAGVVVGWRSQSGTAVVALRSGRLLAVHSLRKVRPGTRVRIEGIKWGKPTAGIKWSVAPRGIKWGIKWSRLSGTYTSSLRPGGPARRTPVRGVVVGRTRKGVAIGTRGGVVVVRMAVWLPQGGGKRTKAIRLPRRGDTILTYVRFGVRGRLIGDGVRYVGEGRSTAVAVSGRLSRVDAGSRKIRVTNADDPAFPVNVTLGVPTTINMARLPAGGEVAATSTLNADGSLRTASISDNSSFDASNDPANTQVAPPPADDETLLFITRIEDRWTAGRAEGGVTDQVLYDDGLARIRRAEAAARDGNLPVARAELQAFIAEVTAGIPAKVTPTVAAEVIARAGAAVDRLGG
jgi:hypothetical protein